MKNKKLKYSFATVYSEKDGALTDLIKVAKALQNWGDIPKRLNDTRAYEIAAMARDYLRMVRKRK